MTIRTDVPGATQYAIQSAISAYADEAYTNAVKLNSTGIAGTNPDIDVNTETFVGQMRWRKPLNPVINVASLTDATDGILTTTSTDHSMYVKSVRTHGAKKINMVQVVSQEDGLAQIAKDFVETRNQDEHNAILSVCKGVAIAELLNGTASASGATGLGGQSFDNDPTDKKYGFYVDLGNVAPVIAATTAVQGAARAEGFLKALAMGYKDYEPTFAYLCVSPEVLMSLRSANMVDSDKVTEANVEMSTILGGKFRLLPTRAAQSLTNAQWLKFNGAASGAGVDLVGTKTSFIILPGSIAFQGLNVPDSVEMDRDASAYMGGGTTELWYRWGYVAQPRGYTWNGSQEKFASDADYMSVGPNAASMGVLTAATIDANTRGTWVRKSTSALSLGILPVFHG